MAKIPENILNEIQDRCDIVEIISNYIPLKPAGRNFKAICPFHHEKTASFLVSPEKQIYHCFGCNSGGNIFNFIKEYEKIDFIDVVKMLAEKTGVKLPEYKKQKDDDGNLVSAIYSLNDIAANYYTNLLENSSPCSEVRRYVEKRRIEESVLKKFRIGYAGDSWSSLSDYLSTRGIKLDMALKSGLVQKGKDGSTYDMFRNRLIFPISDVRGRIIGFGARVLDDETLPKYINSPETVVYKKGEHLYGLDFAKPYIREKGFAIITEGYLDVITSHQYGITNTISSLGTALTVEQIRLLKRYIHNVVMVYDADQAGEMATLRGLDLFLEEGISVKVATLDRGHDPDSFIRKFGRHTFDKAVEKANGLFIYKLDILKEKFDSSDPEGKAEIVKEMLTTICRVRNAVLKAEYIKRLSEELSIKEDAVWDELKKVKRYEGRGMRDPWLRHEASEGRREREDGRDKKTIDILPSEKLLLKLMLEDENVIGIVKGNLKPVDFKNPDIRRLVEVLFTFNSEGSFVDAKKLINYLEDKVAPNVISFIVNEEIEITDKERNVSDCIKTIKRENRLGKLKDIQNRLLVISKKDDSEGETKGLLEEFNKLIREVKL